MSDKPETYALDLIGKNGTPFRFVYTPGENKLQYYDRRYTLTPGEPGYGPNNMDENGQSCGPAMDAEACLTVRSTGIRGWHDVEAWNVDPVTTTMVCGWIERLKVMLP